MVGTVEPATGAQERPGPREPHRRTGAAEPAWRVHVASGHSPTQHRDQGPMGRTRLHSRAEHTGGWQRAVRPGPWKDAVSWGQKPEGCAWPAVQGSQGWALGWSRAKQDPCQKGQWV